MPLIVVSDLFFWILLSLISSLINYATMTKQSHPKLRIKLKSYDVRMLESSATKIVWLLNKSWASIKGPVPLPQKRRLYTVNTSHFVNKDSREQYERFTYTRLIDVVETGDKTIELLQNLSIPVWVMVEVKVF